MPGLASTREGKPQIWGALGRGREAGGPAGVGPGLTAAKALPGPGQVTLFPSWKH